MVLFYDGHIWLAYIEQPLPVLQIVDRFPEQVRAIKRVLDLCLIYREPYHHFRPAFHDHGQQPVVRAKNILIIVKGQQQLLGLFLEKIDETVRTGRSGTAPSKPSPI